MKDIHEIKRELNFLNDAVGTLRGLKDFPKEYAKNYHEYYVKNYLTYSRITLFGGLLLFLGSVFFDFTFMADTQAIVIRLYIIFPLLALLCGLSLFFTTYNQIQVLLTCYAIIYCIGLMGIAGMVALSMRELVYFSMLLIALFVITIPRLSFSYTLVLLFGLALTFNIGYMLITPSVFNLYYYSYIGTNYVLIGTSILLVIVSYTNEMTVRKQFLLTCLNDKKTELLTYLSHYDPLTNVANRRYLDKLLQEWFQNAYVQQKNVGILLIDFDYYKEYNDIYGHLVADKTLIEVSEALKNCTPSNGFLARYGGDEFVIVLYHTSPEKLIATAKSIQHAIKKLQLPHRVSPIADRVTVTIGLAIDQPQKPDQELTVFQAADDALLYGKKLQRNHIYLYRNKKKIEKVDEIKANQS